MAGLTTADSDVRVRPGWIVGVGVLTRDLALRRSWLVVFLLLDVLVVYGLRSNPILADAWSFIWPGITLTIQITLVSFALAVVIGLLTAFGRISKNPFLYNMSTLYVELFRGLPLLVIVLIFAFVVAPAVIDFVGGTESVEQDGVVVSPGLPGVPFLDDLAQRLVGIPEEDIPNTRLRSRDIDMGWRIVFAFAVTYGAFMSEVFRAGIESIGRGQMEAARSLGMSYIQSMRYVVLPQAVRNVLPALVNNFVFLLKDTSLASVVAVPEISQLTRQYSSNRFRYPEGLLVLAFIYLNLTVLLSMGAYYLESRLHVGRR